MKIWKLTRTDSVGYDEYDSFIVRAKTEELARELIQKERFSVSWDEWSKNEKNITCEEVKKGGKEEIILGSFNAG